MTDLKTVAIWAHEMFTSLLEAGFDREDALELVACRLPDPPGSEEDAEAV